MRILKTFVHIVEKPTPQQWMSKKLSAWSGGDFQGILGDLYALKAYSIQPASALFRRWPFSDIGFQPVPLCE